MPNADLKGKTVMIATTDKMLARHLAESLEEFGATVVFSKRSPHHPSAVPVIEEEIGKHAPKIDTLIIHNSNIEMEEGQDTALRLTKNLRETCPVIVCDSCERKTAIQPLQNAGAKYLNFMDLEYEQIAAAVADAVAQHGKPGRKVGG